MIKFGIYNKYQKNRAFLALKLMLYINFGDLIIKIRLLKKIKYAYRNIKLFRKNNTYIFMSKTKEYRYKKRGSVTNTTPEKL